MSRDHIDLLTLVADSLTMARGLRSGAETVLDLCIERLNAAFGFVAIEASDASMPIIAAARGLGAADFRRLEERLGKSSVWGMHRRSKPFALDDLSVDPALRFVAFGTGARSLMGVSMGQKAAPSGMLCLGFREDARRASEPHLLRVMAGIAGMLTLLTRVDHLSREESIRTDEEKARKRSQLRESFDFSQVIGKSAAVRHVINLAKQIARSNTSVLIRGEKGTGKQQIAAAIHYNSLRAKGPLITIDCASLPPSMVEKEIFGDARRAHGLGGSAAGGTILLNEISGLPLDVQHRLLEAFDRKTDARLLTTTSKDLESLAHAGLFSDALFHRLRVFAISLPPLRERGPDILLLAEHFVDRYQRVHGKDIKRLSTPAIDMLMAYHFPGNVRELENAIERAVMVCDGNVLHGHHLPATLQTAEFTGTETYVRLSTAVESFERGLIMDALKSTKGNVARAARMLDSTERILGYKVHKYGIDPQRFRQ
jgi:Nif-specific regulatory protein